MKSLAALLFAAFPAVAQVPELPGSWDFICPEGQNCIIKKEALVELAARARLSCSLRDS